MVEEIKWVVAEVANVHVHIKMPPKKCLAFWGHFIYQDTRSLFSIAHFSMALFPGGRHSLRQILCR
jgi:hypothetical protein